MTGEWRHLGLEPHTCPTPGWWARWRAGAVVNAIWVCDCGQAYQLIRSAYDGDLHWKRITQEQLAIRAASLKLAKR